MNDDEVMFSRGPMSHPLGKLTRIEKVALPEVVSEIIEKKAAGAGMTFCELHREILCRWACGDYLDSVINKRRELAAINAAGKGHENN